MQKLTTVLVGFLLAGLGACSREAPAPRDIRAHTRVIGGIAHGDPADKAERYCSFCHGGALAGGQQLEPSCYQCHGKNWTQDAALAARSFAPADHSLVQGGRFSHKNTLFTPDGDCTACHGAQLQGTRYYPSCELCHTMLWRERTPPP